MGSARCMMQLKTLSGTRPPARIDFPSEPLAIETPAKMHKNNVNMDIKLRGLCILMMNEPFSK